MFSPRARKMALTVHVSTSVGFVGAVCVFLALAADGLLTASQEHAAAAYVSMQIATWRVIVPLSFAALITGIVQSLGTPWGLFRYYWVLAKLALTVFGAAVLLVHTQPVALMAHMASRASPLAAELDQVKLQLVVASAAGVAVLLLTTALSIYKPRGLTPYGWRQQQAERLPPSP